ncbi:YitT family protein [uncultured Eudoraea sp.]|uniref:YitT family protein n=1 Tax=uncultured Eudoraea sp. TaxID=1035614 RepID=UPI00345C353F
MPHTKLVSTIPKLFIRDTFFISTGILSAAFGLESFLLPNRFIDGGVTGISLLITETTTLPLYSLIFLVNLPFLLLGWKVIGKNFAIKTTIAILGLSLSLALIEFPEITGRNGSSCSLFE